MAGKFSIPSPFEVDMRMRIERAYDRERMMMRERMVPPLENRARSLIDLARRLLPSPLGDDIAHDIEKHRQFGDLDDRYCRHMEGVIRHEYDRHHRRAANMTTTNTVLGELKAKQAQWQHSAAHDLPARFAYIGRETFERMKAELGGPENYHHQELHITQTILGLRVVIVDGDHIGIGI